MKSMRRFQFPLFIQKTTGDMQAHHPISLGLYNTKEWCFSYRIAVFYPQQRLMRSRFEMTSKTISSKPSAESMATTTIWPQAVEEIGGELRSLLADFFTPYLKTKNFRWHMRGSDFRDYYLLLDEQGEQVFEATDAITERGRKIGAATLKSVGDVTRHQRLKDNDSENLFSACHVVGTLLKQSTTRIVHAADSRDL